MAKNINSIIWESKYLPMSVTRTPEYLEWENHQVIVSSPEWLDHIRSAKKFFAGFNGYDYQEGCPISAFLTLIIRRYDSAETVCEKQALLAVLMSCTVEFAQPYEDEHGQLVWTVYKITPKSTIELLAYEKQLRRIKLGRERIFPTLKKRVWVVDE